MGFFNIRCLLIAVIILCKCVTWTASRHHYNHNVHGHRSRHRRQGAGLFLSSSYVVPGGEGSGAWGEWGEVSSCSRTCGGGVASQKRICLELGPDGQPLCRGGDTKYFSCQTQDCPDGSRDFRAEQCSEYDSQAFKGIRYTWVPYTKGPNPCELNCMPRGERFYYRQKNKVIDGTRCNEESFDVCVNGACQPVGCDMMLGSAAREDKCRQCRGDGANCHTANGLLDTQDLRNGYNDILLIPQGATSIYIAEVRSSSNYLAIRAKNNTYYLNGDYHIDFPRSIIIAGTIWHYERSQDGLPSPDKLRCQGPTDEPLYLSILIQEPNVGVEYEYSVPSALAPPPNAQYNWVHDEFSACSAPCGGGIQTRNVTCRSREDLDVVDEQLCEAIVKPVTEESCNKDACPATWVDGPWSPCSKPCGEGGTRSRQVHCEKIITNGLPSVVADKECFDLLGPKPPLFEECNLNATCPQWFAGPWKPCDKLCGEGKQTRQVVCYQKSGARVEVLGDEQCGEEKPASEQPCLLHPCDGVDWVLSEWAGCDNCLSKVRTRSASCATKDHKVVAPELCAYHPTPVLQEPCDRTKLPPCEVQWYATQWSKCSAECGEGTQSRNVFCGMFDGASVLKVDDSRCDNATKYNDTKRCEVPKDKCPSKWFAGPWSECSAKCNGGEQYRRVMCLRGEQAVSDCDGEAVLDSAQSCNTGPCNEDETLPLNPNSTPVMDDYEDEDCEEDEEYPEAGDEYDSDLGTAMTEDLMFSDSPFTSELESEFTSESGSGYETSLSTEEGSGYGSTDVTSLTDEEWTTDTSSTEDTETVSTDSSTLSEESSTTDSSLKPSYSTDTSVESSTDATGSTENSSTVSSDASDASTTIDETTETGLTETTEAGSTLSKSTDETEVSNTESLGSTDTTEITETDSATEISTESSDYTDESSTSSYDELATTDETTITESTISDETSETSSTEPTGSTEENTADSSSDTTESSISTGSTDISSDESTTETTDFTEAGSTTEEESTVTGSTEESSESGSADLSTSTESVSTTEAESTVSGPTEESTETGSTDLPSSTESGSVTEAESTVSGSTEESTEPGSTESSATDLSGSTDDSEFSSTTEASSTDLVSESSTDESGSTAESATEETGSTEESTTEVVSTESTSESTEDTGPTESGATEETGSTESTSESSSTTEAGEESTVSGSTLWDWASTIELVTKKQKCKPRIAKCKKSKFGCCPDKRTTAAGPFDEGCANPKTCKETKFGCCADGVSPATGPNDKGCPIPPCIETLFGCCKSDKKTPAEGNDQEGCPPPPPACKSSKFGCCKDGKTQATGPKKKGCPETAPSVDSRFKEDCFESKFGCCSDNVTAATGADGEGCPCNATEFGCCPDGVAPAGGAQMEGCVMSCNSSAYGCCHDGQTPAHGPSGQGCCLLDPFGCCPDNYRSAEGPHFEGCDCQYAPYGCCPDNITIATGPNNAGCGCEHSQHGCCPDRHAEASGPNYEGCDCSTFQFRCCDDGIKPARGPGGQGCLCQQSEFGCCGDDKTPASGPNHAGCDCSTSKFGCCPDGETPAHGSKFLGCTDKPENRQAGCSLSTDRGPCTNYSVLWYYDMEYGGCSRFWYGGCEGNGNRFTSKEECEDVCVQPAPKDACNLPKVKGACVGYHPRWYYDAEREQCGQFIFGGCLGNANNFESRDACQVQCEPHKSTDTCSLSIERGECAGAYARWGFDAEEHSCRPFEWGGCGGNGNRYRSEQACRHHCLPPGQQLPECKESKDVGNCTEKLPAWSFSLTENRCVPFYFTGCGGNGNRFGSEQSCAEACPSLYVKDTCTLPALTGECADYSEKWYYDTSIKRCRQFYYGGCGGNENRFSTQQECESQCTERLATTTTSAPLRPEATTPADVCSLPSMTGECDDYTEKWFFDSSISRCRQFYYGGCGGNANRFASEAECAARCVAAPTQAPAQRPAYGQELCFLDVDAGPCTDVRERWAYDTQHGACVPFQYGGCGGNQNNFPDQDYCRRTCGSIQDVCQLPMLQGECESSVMQWFYDPSADACSQFTYSGCGGNDNRFESLQACESRCRTGPEPVANTPAAKVSTTLAPIDEVPPECRISAVADEECEEEGEVWFLDPEQNACVAMMNPASGRDCRRAGTFPTEEACERSCGAFRNIEVCRYPVDSGPCRAAIPKFFYDKERDSCMPYSYGGCHGGPNRFSSVQECEDICKYEKDPCKRAPKALQCVDYDITWFYSEARGECFSYGSCDKEDTTRFSSREQCEGQCRGRPAPEPATPAPAPAQPEECRTPSSLAPCGRNVTAYYYDAERRACLAAPLGACGIANNYKSEEECLRRCGLFRGLDPCRSPLDVGLCSDAIPKFYWKLQTGRCEQFAYSGCGGGPNRFSSEEECYQLCGETGPEAACLEPVQTGEGGAECAGGRRWYYDAGAAQCLAFTFVGCRAGRNHFRSPQECATHCRVVLPESEGNEVLPDCDDYNEECANIRCEFGVQRTRTTGGCERCACVRVEVDCTLLQQECQRLNCTYGRRQHVGDDGCERCTCIQHPCEHKNCSSGERCVASPFRHPITQEVAYTADCYKVEKEGTCPPEDTTLAEGQCRRECNDDADCRGAGKCCARGCSQLCLAPASATTSAHSSTTHSPELPQAPQANPETQPEVAAAEGGKATLRCLFHGNPPPKITWRRGEITIDGDVGRYRLTSDGALEIVSLYRNDSGVYICVAENVHGVSRQEVRLEVNDPVTSAVGIAGDEGAEVAGELGHSLNVRCLAYGHPPPSIYWYRGRSMLPYSSELYEARGNVLQIRRLSDSTLGDYSCQAYNGVGKAAYWTVRVSARRSPRPPPAPAPAPAAADTPAPPPAGMQAAATPPPEIDVPVYTVPVNTSISVDSLTLAPGGELSLPCDVEGYPLPEVYWTRDGVRLVPSNRLQLTEARLTLSGLTTEDGGVYGCHARNEYSSHYSTVQVAVQGVAIPVHCTDNPFFADCQLIVRSKFCHHHYYSKFCCKSCVEAGQLNPLELGTQSDEAWKKRK